MGKRGEKEPEEFHHKEIEKGYFYNAVAGKVDHAIDIVLLRAMAEIDDLEIFDLFNPHWRKKDFYENDHFTGTTLSLLPFFRMNSNASKLTYAPLR